MNRIREFASTLRCDPEIAAHLITLRNEMRLMARGVGHASLVKEWGKYGLPSEKYLPISLAPLFDGALITAGISVGWHLPPRDVNIPPALRRAADRFLMGELIHHAKAYKGQHIVVDEKQLQTFAALAVYALSPSAFAQTLDVIISMPSSRHTNTLPHKIATRMSLASNIPLVPEGTLRFRRSTGQSKETHDYWTKRDLLDGSMEAETPVLSGRSVLIVDDICKYGATFIEAARACREAGATSVSVMALSKTYTCQRIPVRKPVSTNSQIDPADVASRATTISASSVATTNHQCGFPDDMIEVPFS
jgi:predicted amidophosphoribosyltransferase